MSGQIAVASTIVAPRTAWLLLWCVIGLWGANWPVMKVGLDYLPPLTFAAIRMVLGAITMFAVAAVTGQLRLPSRHDPSVVINVGGLVLILIGVAAVTMADRHARRNGV